MLAASIFGHCSEEGRGTATMKADYKRKATPLTEATPSVQICLQACSLYTCPLRSPCPHPFPVSCPLLACFRPVLVLPYSASRLSHVACSPRRWRNLLLLLMPTAAGRLRWTSSGRCRAGAAIATQKRSGARTRAVSTTAVLACHAMPDSMHRNPPIETVLYLHSPARAPPGPGSLCSDNHAPQTSIEPGSGIHTQ